jgi:hypothetical protein
MLFRVSTLFQSVGIKTGITQDTGWLIYEPKISFVVQRGFALKTQTELVFV